MARVIGPSAAPRTSSSPIEGVVVLGMHRSGTSLVTRLVSLLGLALCDPDDLLAGFPGNPRGYWESKALVSFDNRLLRELGGSWFCPPPLEPEEIAKRLEPRRARALSLLHLAHPQRPFVWKDPRTCLLLPFWARVLERRALHIVVGRHPTEISESLERRNGFSAPHGLALWERHMRLALLGSAGQPTVLCTYDEVLAEPLEWCRRLAVFMRELGMAVPAGDEPAISAFVADGLRRGQRPWDELGPSELFPPERIALADATARAGTHLAFEPPVLPPEAPATEATLSEIRRASAEKRPVEARLAAGARRPAATRNDADHRPAATLILAAAAPLAEASVPALAVVLAAGSEVIASGAERHAEALSGSGLTWREIAAPGEGSGEAPRFGSETLARALEAAAGRTVLISTARLPQEESWYERVHVALRRSKAGCVGAALHLEGDRGARGRWGAFADDGLTPVLVAARPGRGLAQAPLLWAGLLAFDRRVLSGAGGLDAEFDTVPAALAELSLRLWRMGFGSRMLREIGVRAGPQQLATDVSLYDRLRIAALHLSRARCASSPTAPVPIPATSRPRCACRPRI